MALPLRLPSASSSAPPLSLCLLPLYHTTSTSSRTHSQTHGQYHVRSRRNNVVPVSFLAAPTAAAAAAAHDSMLGDRACCSRRGCCSGVLHAQARPGSSSPCAPAAHSTQKAHSRTHDTLQWADYPCALVSRAHYHLRHYWLRAAPRCVLLVSRCWSHALSLSRLASSYICAGRCESATLVLHTYVWVYIYTTHVCSVRVRTRVYRRPLLARALSTASLPHTHCLSPQLCAFCTWPRERDEAMLACTQLRVRVSGRELRLGLYRTTQRKGKRETGERITYTMCAGARGGERQKVRLGVDGPFALFFLLLRRLTHGERGCL